jgi:vacuolar protein sorting-associated protein 35
MRGAAAQDIEEEQVMVARMLHQLTSPDPSLQFAILRAARAHLELGGPLRLRYTFPALAFCGLKAIRNFAGPGAAATGDQGKEAEDAGSCEPVTVESALQWLLELVLQLADVPAPMQALRLLLACAHVSSQEAGLEMLTYEFFEQVWK